MDVQSLTNWPKVHLCMCVCLFVFLSFWEDDDEIIIRLVVNNK